MQDQRKQQLMKLLGVDLSDLDVKQPSMEDEESFKVEEEAVPESTGERYQADPAVTAQLKKLLGRSEDLDLDEVEVQPEVIDDPMASPEARKPMIQKVRNKYLGQ